MILDERLEFADAVSVAASASTFIVGDVIDLGNTTNYIGDDGTLTLIVDVDTQIITAGSTGSITFYLLSDAKATLNNAGTGAAVVAECTTHATSLAIVTDDATALDTGIEAGTATYLPNQAASNSWTAVATPYYRGKRPPILKVKLPMGTYERYLGVVATVASQETTAGKVNAYLVSDAVAQRIYPDNASIE